MLAPVDFLEERFALRAPVSFAIIAVALLVPVEALQPSGHLARLPLVALQVALFAECALADGTNHVIAE